MSVAASVHPRARGSAPPSLTVNFDANEFRVLPIPGLNVGRLGTCYVRVTEVPAALEEFMKVNPRVPNRTDKERLSGPVPRAIIKTLEETPEDMAIKNAGIYLVVESFEHIKGKGGVGSLHIRLSDSETHGIVNGGHTFAAIRQVIDDAKPDKLKGLERAYVRLHLLHGIPQDKLPEIAEGLNRSKQVQNPSLENLRGHFESIKQVMRGHAGEDQIAYHEGADGDVDIGEVLAFIEMFNLARYPLDVQPSDLYGRQYQAVAEFGADVRAKPSPVEPVIARLPEILRLADMIRRDAPHAAKKDAEFEIGRMKIASNKNSRVGSPEHQGTRLHFINDETDYKLPNAWLYPMLGAFRANAQWDAKKWTLRWKVPIEEVLKACLPDLVSVCVQEHRANMQKPEWVGKRESAYRQCSLYVELFLAKRRV